MALIKCPECNREISDTAEACPFCGCNPKKIEQFEKKVISLEDVPSRTKTRGLALMVMSIGCFSSRNSNSSLDYWYIHNYRGYIYVYRRI